VTSREVDRAARQWADAQQAQLAAVPSLRGFAATVAATSPAVTVTWRGADYTATRVLPSYTPGVGDRVLCLLVDDQLVVLG
jgi:hypothetical protein